MNAPRNAFTPDGQSLAPYILVAVLGHVGVLCALMLLEVLFSWLNPPPEIDPSKAMEVTILGVAAPKFAETPQDAMRAAPPPKAPEAPPPPPAEAPPPVPNPSDLALQVPEEQKKTEETPKPPKAPAAEEDPLKAAREQAARDQKLSSLLDDLAEGPENRDAAGPVVDPSSRARSGIGDPSGSAVCTAWAKRVQLVLDQQFVVLPAFQGKGLAATLSMTFTAEGGVRDASVAKSSGNAGYDGSAVASAKNVSSVPAPPAECAPGGLATLKVRYYKP